VIPAVKTVYGNNLMMNPIEMHLPVVVIRKPSDYPIVKE
jgi:hypothetical protein